MITISFPPELEAVLKKRAKGIGSTLEEVVLDSLQQSFLKQSSTKSKHDEWAERLLRIATPAGVSLAEEAISREALYD